MRNHLKLFCRRTRSAGRYLFRTKSNGSALFCAAARARQAPFCKIEMFYLQMYCSHVDAFIILIGVFNATEHISVPDDINADGTQNVTRTNASR